MTKPPVIHAPRRPLIGIPCDWRTIGIHPFHAVGAKYVTAAADGAGGLPMLIPVTEQPLDPDEILTRVDGLMFTGSPSNVHPELYAGTPPREGVMLDPNRDATTLPLLRAAIARGVPIFAICRGLQELNVAFGGTLHQHVEEIPGRLDHREDKSQPIEVQYGPAHDVTAVRGGMIEKILSDSGIAGLTFSVNSVHSQGIDRLGEGLRIEATAPDGQIEAIAVEGAPAFALAVQWHPEWRFWENPVARALFAAFGRALLPSAKEGRENRLEAHGEARLV
ncbi:MAG: gamma-glutamyl-gamma-aminobutyrate hydrolase family protein [Alphaproteobacteria bacterium]|nr:gamma-glutamyl-gamma-aminobutyrate hydrolase family protein [Alphaproteobacteria bacterium]